MSPQPDASPVSGGGPVSESAVAVGHARPADSPPGDSLTGGSTSGGSGGDSGGDSGGSAVRCAGLTYRFGDHVAVDRADLEIGRGETFGLLGPNGAGKTTTIRMLTTLLKPAAGTVTVFGTDAAAYPMRVRRMIGYVPQLLSADATLTGNPLKLLATAAIVVLGSAFFSCLSMSIAGLALSRDRLMGIGQAITMPLFFSSNALYPERLMPGWLQAISKVNPLSYEVDALRGLLIGTQAHLGLDAIVLVGATVLGVTASALLLPRLAR